MPFSNATEARTAITNPNVSNGSLPLFGNNSLLNNTTVFYTNEARTSLAPAGNYVVITNFKSFFVTLGGNGMMTTTPVEIMQGTDTSWVEDRIWQGNTLVANTGSVGGTNMVLSGTSLTDNFWTSRPYPSGQKRWAINNGTINNSSLTNIDLSDMAGFDMILYTGEWGSVNNTTGFTAHNYISAFIHLAPPAGRTGIDGNKFYYFKPDYWIPRNDFDGVSYFRRCPTFDPVKDNQGREKVFTNRTTPYLDLVNINTHTDRSSTRRLKGESLSYRMSTPFIYRKNFNGASFNETWAGTDRYYYTGEGFLLDAVGRAYSIGLADKNYWSTSTIKTDIENNPSMFLTWGQRIRAMLESMLVADTNDWFTGSYAGISYSEANPYRWNSTAFFPGTDSTRSVQQNLAALFYLTDNSTGALNPNNAQIFEMNFENADPARFSQSAGTAFNNAVARMTFWAENEEPLCNGAARTKFAIYAGAPYIRSFGGNPTIVNGWKFLNSSNLTSSQLYSDYNNFYIGSANYNTLDLQYWYIGAINCMQYFFCSNYQYQLNNTWYFYNMLHSYDINKKIIAQVLGTTNNDKRVCGYNWRQMDVVSETDYSFQERLYVSYSGNIAGERPDASPAFLQSYAVWGMAYCDGATFWDDWVLIGEERQAVYDLSVSQGRDMVFDQQILNNYIGNVTSVGKGAHDWSYIGHLQVAQNRDIVEAATSWLVPDYKKNGTYTSGTGNYPVSLYANQTAISKYKLSADGTEALVIIMNPFNNGYTKETHTLRLPAKGNYEFTVDTWGTFTTVMRLKNL
jgi:hypothetical protein